MAVCCSLWSADSIAGSSPISTDGVSIYLVSLLIVVFLFVILCALPMCIQLPGFLGGTVKHSKRSKKPLLTKKSAVVMVVAWVACNLVIVVEQQRTAAGGEGGGGVSGAIGALAQCGISGGDTSGIGH